MSKKREMQESSDIISSGDFRGSDVRDLFVQMRYSGSDVLFDIANFIVHRGSRNQGRLFNHSRSSISDTLQSLKEGRLTSSQTIEESVRYSPDDIFNELIEALYREGVNLDEVKLREQKDKVINVLKSVLDNTKLEIAYGGVKYCSLKLGADGYLYVVVAIGRKFKNKLISIENKDATVEIVRPLF